MKRLRRTIWILSLGLIGFCIVAGTITAIRNRSLSLEPMSVEQLHPVDKQRLAEAIHLKRELGDQVWPGWGSSETPHLLWNREASFLTGFPSQPNGWDVVEDDDFYGDPYFRQATDEHTNFAVQVDGIWVGSIATKGETDAFLIGMFQEVLPPVIESAFPYRLMIQPSEVQIGGLLHEDFHVYQIQVAKDKLDSAESVYPYGDDYWSIDEDMRSEWREEIDLLIDALRSNTNLEKKDLIVKFLDVREQRRQDHRLSTEMIDYERKLEWLEGLAKYVEVSIWQTAYQSRSYQPVLSPELDPEFREYQSFNRRFTLEVNQLRRRAGTDGDTRFYYTGMAMGMVLDDLFPGWKERIFVEDIYLEDLLEAAVLASSQ